MSNSLLTLLEIMDQVVQEEEEAGASGGDAPTEQELWDAISPGLLDLAVEKLKMSGRNLSKYKLELITKEMASKNIGIPFRILNEFLRKNNEDTLTSKEKELINKKVEYIADWLVRLNYFHLENPDAGYAFANQPEVIQKLQSSEQYWDRSPPKPAATDLLKNLIQNKFENISKIDVSKQRSVSVFNRVLSNLENGIGVIVTKKMITTKGGKKSPADLAESFNILDKFDYIKLSQELKNKQSQIEFYLNNFIELAKIQNDRIPTPLKPFHTKFLIKYLSEAFNHMFESEDLEYFKIFKYLKSSGLSDLPEVLSTFFNRQFQKFSEKYKDILQKGGSGETFTSPESINRKTLNDEAVQAIVKEIFKDFNDNSIQGRIEHLTKKMDIFKSKDISSEMEKQNINSLDFINRVLMMEYFIKFSKDFSSVEAGILFEYFLAALFGGTATGERGDAVDFEVQSGGEIKLGSAKFISPETASKKYFNQAISGFEQFKGKTITYIVGIKKPSDISFSLNYPSSLDLQEVDIYSFNARYEGEKNLYINNEKKPMEGLIYDDSFSFMPLYKNKKMKKIGTLQIMSTTEEGIQGFRQLVLKSVNEDTKNLLQTIQELFDHIKDADTKARKYVSSGNRFDGFDAQTALRAADGTISELKIKSSDYENTSRIRQHHRRPAR
jgi:hypothetical protein